MNEKNDLFEQVFDHQMELMRKFHAIEKINLPSTFTPTILGMIYDDEDFQLFEGQRRLRELIGRIFEEVVEVQLAPKIERSEEIADVFHFLIEFWITVRLTPDQFLTRDPLMNPLEWTFHNISAQTKFDGDSWPQWHSLLLQLGLLQNLLKNRPWKQTPRMLDVLEFRNRCLALMDFFVIAAHASGETAEKLFDSYLKKKKVNDERIQSGK